MGFLKPPRGAPDVDGPRRQTLAPQLLTGTFHFEFFAAGTLIRLVNSLANRAQEIKGGGGAMALFIETSFFAIHRKNKHSPPHTKNMHLKINNEAMFG